MESILSRFQPFPDQAIHRLGPPLHQAGHGLLLFPGKMGENVIFRGYFRRRAADAQLHPDKFLGAQGVDDGDHPPVAPGPAPLHQLDPPPGDIQIIVNHHQVPGKQFEIVEQ